MSNEEEARNFLKFWFVWAYMCIGSRLISTAYKEVLDDEMKNLLDTYVIINDIDKVD